jgi:hypothetical protein
VNPGPKRRESWQIAFDAQMGLWRWYRTPGGMRWMRGSLLANVEGHSDHLRSLITRLYDAEMGRLIDCDPIYVSEEMCEVVEAARHSFEPEPLLETDLMTPRGFLWWAKPLEMSDRGQRPLSIRAVSWSREYAAKSEEASLEVLARLNEPERYEKLGDRIKAAEMQDLIDEGAFEAVGVSICLYAERDHYLGVTQERNVEPVPDHVWADTASVPVVPFHLTPWHFGQEFQGNEVDEKGDPTGAADWWTMVQVTLRLMQQKIAAKHFFRPDRAGRREAKRLGHPEEREIIVVRLRRERSETSEPTGKSANYSHRFIVGGHWRNQPYPKEGIHRQIWISDYVKGDDHLPLIVRPRRVWKWDR